MMTRKDYVNLATALKGTGPLSHTPHATAQWRLDVVAVATVLEKDNPSFNRDRFLRAAGVSDVQGALRDSLDNDRYQGTDSTHDYGQDP